MSYNIDSVECLKLDAQIFAKDVRYLLANHGDKLPEVCFLRDLPTNDPDTTPLQLKNLWWYGEGSGHGFEILRDEVALKIIGHVEAVFTWEGGDSVSGLIIKDGKVTECDVKYRLVPKKVGAK